jgi:hypothetical protein
MFLRMISARDEPIRVFGESKSCLDSLLLIFPLRDKHRHRQTRERPKGASARKVCVGDAWGFVWGDCLPRLSEREAERVRIPNGGCG